MAVQTRLVQMSTWKGGYSGNEIQRVHFNGNLELDLDLQLDLELELDLDLDLDLRLKFMKITYDYS